MTQQKFNCYYTNGALEIIQEDGGGDGFLIQFESDDRCKLYELTSSNKYFEGYHRNVYDAIEKAMSWT